MKTTTTSTTVSTSTLESKRADVAPFLLGSFGNQVGGRASILCYDPFTICKPYVSREIYFYHYLPVALKEFTPEFRGVINVSFIETFPTNQLLTYALPNTYIHPGSRDVAALVDKPSSHSKRCIRDYGKTHVIYPTDPCLESLMQRTYMILSLDDHIDDLAQDLSSGLSLQQDTTDEESSISIGSSGLQNPWNSKVMEDAWTKLKSDNEEDQRTADGVSAKARVKRFMMLENITSPYRYPCVLDLKMGTRVRDKPSPAKLARHVTAIQLGARLSGMQIYCPWKKSFDYVNKYSGHNLTICGLETKLLQFFSRGRIQLTQDDLKNRTQSKKDGDTRAPSSVIDRHLVDLSLMDGDLVEEAIRRLSSLRLIVASLDGFRFYSCSLLLIYEGDNSHQDNLLCSHGDGDVASCATPSGAQPVVSKEDVGSSANNKPSAEVGGHRGKKVEKSQLQSSDLKKKKKKSSEQKTKDKTTADNGPVKPLTAPPDKPVNPLTAPPGKPVNPLTALLDKPANPLTAPLDVRLIDFAHFCYQDPVLHPGSDGGFLYGLDKIIALLRAISLK